MTILEKLIKKQEEDFYLRNTTYLAHIPEKEFRDQLTGLYNGDQLIKRAIATILNAIYTDGKPTFYLSVRSLEALFKEDKNLSYKGRKGISSTEYRQAYAEIFNFFKIQDSGFSLVAEASKEHKTPACAQLVDESTLLSMGNQMMIKLASNWHQMAIRQLSILRKCHENTEKSQNSSHINTKDKVKNNNQSPSQPFHPMDEEFEVSRTTDTFPVFNDSSSPEEVRIAAEPTITTGVTAEAILAKWKPIKVDKDELENILSDLFATLKYYSFPKDELPTKKILRAMFGPAPSKKIDWLVEKAEVVVDEQRELAYSPELSIQSGSPSLHLGNTSTSVLRERDFTVPGAYALYYDSLINGREIHKIGGSIVEYYNQQAYGSQFKDITQEIWEKLK